MSLFFANKDYYPQLQVQPDQQFPSETAKSFIAKLGKVHTKLKQTIAEV